MNVRVVRSGSKSETEVSRMVVIPLAFLCIAERTFHATQSFYRVALFRRSKIAETSARAGGPGNVNLTANVGVPRVRLLLPNPGITDVRTRQGLGFPHAQRTAALPPFRRISFPHLQLLSSRTALSKYLHLGLVARVTLTLPLPFGCPGFAFFWLTRASQTSVPVRV